MKLCKYDKVQEQMFDIQLKKDLFPTRSNMQLVFVDIPGISEASMAMKFIEYVNSKWDMFDCVIVMMDSKQGINTKEQVFLLNLVKENLQSKKDIPVIILCNKVDDPADDE